MTHKGLMSVIALVQSGCSPVPASLVDHQIQFQRKDSSPGVATIVLRASNTAASHAVTVIGVGRGQLQSFAVDSAIPQSGFAQLGRAMSYSNWPDSGTALYAGSGDGSPILVETPREDEITVATVTATGSRIEDYSWIESAPGYRVDSAPVTTTGPATLVAFWWGDAGVWRDKIAVPANGFKLVESVLESGALVQCAVAVREVRQAGTYSVSWRNFPRQGAQLWLVAIQ